MSYWVPPERRAGRDANREAIEWQVTNRPYTYVYTDFVPMLRERGVSADDIETMFVDNPRRLLTGS
jgi:phosphotriesterase-related protein